MSAHTGTLIGQIASFVDVKSVQMIGTESGQLQIDPNFVGGSRFTESDGAIDFSSEYGDGANRHFIE